MAYDYNRRMAYDFRRMAYDITTIYRMTYDTCTYYRNARRMAYDI
jgi:hypothetical protein